jgi:hypothetical protein
VAEGRTLRLCPLREKPPSAAKHYFLAFDVVMRENLTDSKSAAPSNALPTQRFTPH